MIRLLDNNDKEQALLYTERNHLETTFLTGNIVNFGLENDNKTGRCADYYGYFENEELKGIIPFYNLGSCIPHYEDQEAIKEFTNLMKERSFGYLIGMRKIIEPLYNIIKSSKEEISFSDSSYFINNNFMPFKLDGVEFIDGAKLPLEKTRAFLSETIKVGFAALKNVELFPKLLSERNSEENFIFLLKDGEIKAQANVQTCTKEINQIGAVYTLASERGKGYCKAVVSEVCKKNIQRGKLLLCPLEKITHLQ